MGQREATAVKRLIDQQQGGIPEVFLGDLVLWYDGGTKNDTPFAAIVTAGGPGGIVSLWIVGPGAHNGMVRDGVRHVNDPRKVIELDAEHGRWDHTPRYYALQELIAKVDVLITKL